MINKYPGTCGCGTRVEAGLGEARKSDEGRWEVICADCLMVPAKGGGVRMTQAERASVEAYEGSQLARDDEEILRVKTSSTAYTLLSGHAASPYQAAVFDHFRYGRGSIIVKAVAGAGKTTTIKNAVRYLPPRAAVQLLAFNVEAAGQLKAALDELQVLEPERSYRSYRAGTFHSLGMGAVRRHLNLPDASVKVDDGKVRKILKAKLDSETFDLYASFACSLVGYAKGEGIGCLVPDVEERWWDLVNHHGLYLDTTEADPAVGVALARQALAWSNEAAKTGLLDYDDMLYLVVLWKLRLWQNDVVVVDEVQDTNPVRRAILKLALRPSGRLIAVGDPKQSIYGFTGASVDAMDLIAKEFNARELPLTVSYRCAQAVVERAQTWVQYIEASASAPVGAVHDDVPLHAAMSMLGAEDAVLCRQTAPLVSVAYALIARGRPCRIMGREIGEGLVNLIERQRARGIEALARKLELWREREVASFTAKGDERAAEAVTDRVGCVMVIVQSLPEPERTVPALVARIRSLFDDSKTKGVLTLATVHRAKGQEWKRVAVLRPELMPSKAARQLWMEEQEFNLCYVAATRAKEQLIYVTLEDMVLDPPTQGVK